MADYDDPTIKDAWCSERRADVIAYLDREGVGHGAVGDWPAWHVPPYVSVWAIESRRAPGRVGWWVISGDLPTDYVSAATVYHPRTAMRAFAEKWTRQSALMSRSESDSSITLGRPEDWPDLAPLLSARAKMLLEWSNDESLWEED